MKKVKNNVFYYKKSIKKVALQYLYNTTFHIHHTYTSISQILNKLQNREIFAT